MANWGAGILLVGLFGPVACSTNAGTPQSIADAGVDSAPQGSKYGDSACGSCAASACGSQIATCNADPSCAAYLACLDACGVTPTGDADPACESACPASSGSAGIAAQAALTACRTQGAGAACAECGGTDGGTHAGGCVASPVLTQTCGPSSETSTCVKCNYEKCCDSVTKVFGGGPATDFGSCWQACNDYACVSACEKKYPNGVQGFGEYAACTAVNCIATGACSGRPCSLCQDKNCACELTNCRVDAGCFDILECFAGCTTVACASACSANHPQASVDLYKTLSVCVGEKCVSVCGGH